MFTFHLGATTRVLLAQQSSTLGVMLLLLLVLEFLDDSALILCGTLLNALAKQISIWVHVHWCIRHTNCPMWFRSVVFARYTWNWRIARGRRRRSVVLQLTRIPKLARLPNVVMGEAAFCAVAADALLEGAAHEPTGRFVTAPMAGAQRPLLAVPLTIECLNAANHAAIATNNTTTEATVVPPLEERERRLAPQAIFGVR